MKYIKNHNLFIGEAKDSKLDKPYIDDIKDILQDLDMVDIPNDYKQEIKFSIDKLDDDEILRIKIFGSDSKDLLTSTINETIERLKSYLNSIGCKMAVKYKNPTNQYEWLDTKLTRTKEILIGIRLNNYKMLQATYNSSNYFMLLNDENTIVVLDKDMPKGNRIYYITFKKAKDSNSQYSTLKFEYISSSRNFINFKIYDNHRNPVEWNKLQIFLNKEGIDYGIFNNGFGYMEDDFNNQGYTYSKPEKFFDI
jgi:hypothetical protein